MKRLDVKGFLELYIKDTPIYPSNFPEHLDDVMMFDFSGNIKRNQNLAETQLMLYSRSKDMGKAEANLLNILGQLGGLTNKYIGTTHVLQIKPLGKHVDYAGNDENGREYFVTRLSMLLDDKEQI